LFTYRQAICKVVRADYQVRRVNGVSEPIVAEANAARATKVVAARLMIADLFPF
jgi:hypothetical protein